GARSAAMRRLALLVIALSLCACTCSGGVCEATPAIPPPTGFATTRETVTVHLLLPLYCGGRAATSVETSLIDPDSDIAPFDAGMPMTSEDGFSEDLTFVPSKPGLYHVTVRFEPNFGIAQADVIVAAEMRDAGSVSLAQPCMRAD